MKLHRAGFMIKISIMTLSLLAVPANAQDSQPIKTIADCPRGYVLTVQDTGQPLIASTTPSAASTYTVDIQAQAPANAQQAAAPRQFVTGCVLPQQTHLSNK